MARVTIEDCLEEVPSRFSLVHIAAQRARQILKGSTPHVLCENKPVVTSLREVASGDVWVKTSDEEEAEA